MTLPVAPQNFQESEITNLGNLNSGQNSGQMIANQNNINKQIIQNGLTATETRQMVRDQIFVLAEELKKNLIHISSESQKIVNQRIESYLLEDFSPKLVKLSERLVNIESKLKSPDVQYSFNQVIQAVGRRSSKNFNQSLANLMVARIESEDNSAEALIYNEAISVFPKLTSTQLGILSFAFLGHYVMDRQSKPLSEMNLWLEANFGWLKNSQFSIDSFRDIEIGHLEFTGSAIISVESYSFFANHPFITNYLRKKDTTTSELLDNIIDLHDGTQIKNLRLTSVGIVLAIHWLKIVANLDFETGLWLEI